jgi:L-lactate utilization protein LutC
LFKLDRRIQMPELRTLVLAPQVMLASASAITESGSLVLTSATGSQLTAVAFGASVVIFVIGAQKVSRDLDEGLRRVEGTACYWKIGARCASTASIPASASCRF